MKLSFFRPEKPEVDLSSTREAAERHKRIIESYWAERGYGVRVDIFETKFHPSIRSTRWDVRSDLRNGLPVSAPTKAVLPRQAA